MSFILRVELSLLRPRFCVNAPPDGRVGACNSRMACCTIRTGTVATSEVHLIGEG
jgi:hypothetical protein